MMLNIKYATAWIYYVEQFSYECHLEFSAVTKNIEHTFFIHSEVIMELANTI
jgi:hypothetical protein